VVFPGATQTNISANSGVAGPKGASQNTGKQKIPMLSPAAAAEIIVRGIEKNKIRIYTGKDSRMMNLFYRISPSFATNLIAKMMRSLLPK
jgi:short-subunit dehydrogenase